jgi:hypothetical protein
MAGGKLSIVKVTLALFFCPSSTLIVCVPCRALGITIDLLKLPVASVITPSSIRISLSSKVNLSVLLGKKPEPVIVTVAPTLPKAGLAKMPGPMLNVASLILGVLVTGP